jgi:hypothetical protein
MARLPFISLAGPKLTPICWLAKRNLNACAKPHAPLPLLVTGDDLYAHMPFVKFCGECRRSYILAAKPSFHKEL